MGGERAPQRVRRPLGRLPGDGRGDPREVGVALVQDRPHPVGRGLGTCLLVGYGSGRYGLAGFDTVDHEEQRHPPDRDQQHAGEHHGPDIGPSAHRRRGLRSRLTEQLAAYRLQCPADPAQLAEGRDGHRPRQLLPRLGTLRGGPLCQPRGGQMEPQQRTLQDAPQSHRDQRGDHQQRAGAQEGEPEVVGPVLGRRHVPEREERQPQVGGLVLAVRRGDRRPARDPAQSAVSVAERASGGAGGVRNGVRRAHRGAQSAVTGVSRKGLTVGGGPGEHLSAPVDQLAGAPVPVHRRGGELFGHDQQQFARAGSLPGQIPRLVGVLVLVAPRNGYGHPGEEQQPGLRGPLGDQPGHDVVGTGPRQVGHVHPGQRHRFAADRQPLAGAGDEQRAAPYGLSGQPGVPVLPGLSGLGGGKPVREEGLQYLCRGAVGGGRARGCGTAQRRGSGVDGGGDRSGAVGGDLTFPVAHGLGHVLFMDGAETEREERGNGQQRAEQCGYRGANASE